MQLTELLPLARDSVADPRDAFRRLRALGLDRTELAMALVVVAVVSVLVTQITLLLAPMDLSLVLVTSETTGLRIFPAPPIAAAVQQLVMLVVFVFAIYWGGRLLGGTGRIEDAMLAIAWLWFVQICIELAEILAFLVFPVLAALIGLASMVLFFWLLTGFVAELHGFRSRARVFAGLVIGIFALILILGTLLAVFGLSLAFGPDV